MGLFSKLKKNLQDAAREAIENKVPGGDKITGMMGLGNSLTEGVKSMAGGAGHAGQAPQPPVQEEYIPEEEYAEEAYEEEYEEQEEATDEDLQEFANEVDEMICENEGEFDEDDLAALHERAQGVGFSIEEFDQMLSERIEQLRAAMAQGEDIREYRYRTRSSWRRCPNCGHLNYRKDMYCDWCGYQLRHRVATAVAGAALTAIQTQRRPGQQMNPAGQRPVRVAGQQPRQGAARPAAARPAAARPSAAPAGKPASASAARPAARTTPPPAPAQKKSLFGSSPAKPAKPAEPKKSLFGGSTPKPAEKKKSLFGSDSSSKTVKKSSSSSLLGGKKSSKKSGGIKLGLGKKRR